MVAAGPSSRPRTGELGLVFFSSAGQMFLQPFYSKMIGEICNRAVQANFSVSLFTHDPKLTEFRFDWREHVARLDEAVAGMAVGVLKMDALDTLSRRMPTVAVDGGGPFPFCDSVVADNFEAGRLATEHLLDLGHRRIGFVGEVVAGGMEAPDPSHIQRHEGYLTAMQDATLWPGEDLQFDTHGSGKNAYRMITAAFAGPDHPTAFVCVDDRVALGGIDAARQRGLQVPEDVSFIGIGDAAPSAAKVNLTTVGLNPERIGQTAVSSCSSVWPNRLHRLPITSYR